MIAITKWMKVALINFLIAGLIGVLLRYAFVNEVKWLSYKTYQDAHSNLALLGWAYQGMYALLVSAFISSDKPRKYNVLFWINEAIIIAFTFNLLLGGDRMVSNYLITFLSFFIFYFVYIFLKDSRRSDDAHAVSLPFARISLVFLVLSFVGVYFLIPISMVAGLKKLIFYYLSIQFFLHFQYNGWFVFSVLALIFYLFEKYNIKVNALSANRFKWLTVAGAFLTFFLSVYWGFQNHRVYLWLASLGGIVQLVAVYQFRKELKEGLTELLKKCVPMFRLLLIITIVSFCLKLIMQLVIIHPEIASLAFTVRNYVIAFLHLVFIGFMSCFMFGWAIQQQLIKINVIARVGIHLIVIGFIGIELVLFIQGTLLWAGQGFLSFYYQLIFIVSALLPIGLLFILLNKYHRKQIQSVF